MELFNSPTFESSPRRQPPIAVRSQPLPLTGLQLLNFGTGGENPLKKILDSKWLIPVCTAIVVVIFLVGVWLYNNYIVTPKASKESKSSSKESSRPKASSKTRESTDGKSKRVKSLSQNRRRRSDTTESAKRRTYAISEYDKTTPFSLPD